jgi:hypothetical protein
MGYKMRTLKLNDEAPAPPERIIQLGAWWLRHV